MHKWQPNLFQVLTEKWSHLWKSTTKSMTPPQSKVKNLKNFNTHHCLSKDLPKKCMIKSLMLHNYPLISIHVTEILINNFLNFLLYLMSSLNIYLLLKNKLRSQLDSNLLQNLSKIMIRWKFKRKNKLVKKINHHQDNSSGHQFHKLKNQLKITSNKYLQNSTFK